MRFPVGRYSRQPGPQMGFARRQLPAPLGQRRPIPAQQRRRRQLFDDGHAQVHGGPATDHRLDHRRRGPKPADPQAAPPALAGRTQPDHVVPEVTRRGRRCVEAQLPQRLVQDQGRTGAPGGGGDGRLLLRRHDPARRIVVGPDQIDEARPRPLDRRGQGVDVPPFRRQGDRRGPQPGPDDGVDRVMEGRMVDQHRVSGPRQRPQQQRQRVLPAVTTIWSAVV